MFEQRLGELRERATPGPWRTKYADNTNAEKGIIVGGPLACMLERKVVSRMPAQTASSDAALIVALHSASPLVEELVAAAREVVAFFAKERDIPQAGFNLEAALAALDALGEDVRD